MLIQNPFLQNAQQGTPGNTATPNPEQNQQGRGTAMVPDNEDNNNNQNNNNNNKDNNNKDTKTKSGVNPMDDMSTLWDNEEPDPTKQTPKDTTFLPKIDAEALSKRVGSIDFSKLIKPEHTEAIKAGGEPAFQAMIDLMSSIGRQSIMTAFTASHNMIESGLGSAEPRFLGKVPDHVKDVMIGNGLSESKFAQDPRFSPLIEGVRKQFQAKYTKASPKQIEAAVNKYFQDFVTLGAPSEPKDDATLENNNKTAIKQGLPTADWETWFSLDTKPAA